MKKFYQTPEFRKLFNEWEQKLKESGFQDAEEGWRETSRRFVLRDDCYYLNPKWIAKKRKAAYSDLREDRTLKQSATAFLRYRRDCVGAENKRDYYQMLQRRVSQARFDSDLDRAVMMMKSEGALIVEICRALLKKGILKYRGTIRLIIRKYEHRWGIRHWKPEQMDYNLKNKKPTRSSSIWGPNFQIFIET